MYTKKQHIVRKTIIVSLSFILGFASAVFAAATYDANVQSRAAAMMKTIKSNASTLAPVDQTAYYTLVRLNIESLIQVLMSVNSSLDVEIGSISELNDANILNQITNVSTTGSSALANTSTASTSTFTVTVNSGILYCGDPTRNDYTTYSPVDKKVIIQKSYCNEKGGKIWIKCNGENTNIKTVDSFQGGEILTCPTTSVQTPGTATSVSAGVSTSTNSCKWQYHPVAGPVGAMTIDPSATNCTPNTNGTKAVEVSGNRQTVATCTCPTATTTTNTSTTTTTQNTPSCSGTAPTGEGIIKSTSVFGMVGSDTWSYVANSKGTSTDLGMSCQWTCAPGYTRLENKCTSGSSTVSLSITPATGVFSMVDKNTLTPVVTGLTKENTLICNEVLAHPAYPSAVSPAGYCSNPANFVPFSGNEDWTYTNGKWVGNVKYNASIYGAAGIKARGFWKNKATGTVVTYDLSVIAGSSSTASVGTTNQNYKWSCIVPGPAVVDTSNFSCNSSNVGKSQTIGGYSCNCTGPAVTPGTVSSLNQVTLTVPSGMVACGNPDKNDYTTYGTVGGKVILQKEYCISKGGYAWVVCDGKATNIKNVDTIKDGETFTCPTTNTTTSTNSCKWQYHPVAGPVGAMTIDPSATNCTPNTNGTKAVEVSGNRQTVATCTCPTATTTTTNTNTPTATSNPKTVWTDANFSQKSQYSAGDTLYGYIQGGDVNNTWACLDGPGVAKNDCTDPEKYRKLTATFNGQVDGWQVNKYSGRIELGGANGLYLSSDYPEGTYTGYARTGKYGTSTTATFNFSKTNTQNTPIQNTSSQGTQITCRGTLPANTTATYYDPNPSVVGGTAYSASNEVWAYNKNSCGWTCKSGYYPNQELTACTTAYTCIGDPSAGAPITTNGAKWYPNGNEPRPCNLTLRTSSNYGVSLKPGQIFLTPEYYVYSSYTYQWIPQYAASDTAKKNQSEQDYQNQRITMSRAFMTKYGYSTLVTPMDPNTEIARQWDLFVSEYKANYTGTWLEYPMYITN